MVSPVLRTHEGHNADGVLYCHVVFFPIFGEQVSIAVTRVVFLTNVKRS